MGVVNQTTVISVNGVQMSGGEIDLTIPGGTADPNTGEITFPPAGGGGSGLVETFILDAGNISDKYILVLSDITAETAVRFEIQTLAPQFYGSCYVVDGVNKKMIKWNGLELDGILQIGDKVTVTYS